MKRPMKLAVAGAASAAVLAMSGCASSPEPIDEYAAAHAICWAVQDDISEAHQPDAADAWHKTNEKVCTSMAESMGEQEFIAFWLDEDAVAQYVKDQS